MAKFHIVDENLEIIDSGDNMLSLRMDCKDMNDRLGGKCEVMSENELMAKRGDKTTRGIMIDELVNYDIDNIKKDILLEDYSYLAAVLSGDGFTSYNNMTDSLLKDEYNEMLAMKKGLTH